jgi:hypothetical protein
MLIIVLISAKFDEYCSGKNFYCFIERNNSIIEWGNWCRKSEEFLLFLLSVGWWSFESIVHPEKCKILYHFYHKLESTTIKNKNQAQLMRNK